MRPVGEGQVYLHHAPIDMRLGRNGLAAIAHDVIRQTHPMAGTIYSEPCPPYRALHNCWIGTPSLRRG